MDNRLLVIDLETTFQTSSDKRIDPTPYHPSNRIVSIGARFVEGDKSESLYTVLYHSAYNNGPCPTIAEDIAKFKNWLANADVIVGHNLKFDLSWLLEAGFDIPFSKVFWDTMIAEYVLARGQKPGMSLDDACERYGLPSKDKAISEFLDKGISFENIPIDTVIKYGANDVDITYQLYQHQRRAMSDRTNIGLTKTIEMMNQMMFVLTDIERKGINIDQDALEQVRKQYEEERVQLDKLLKEILVEVMGDTPINLDSPEQLCKVIYSRSVTDKDKWADTFGLGVDTRGSVKKRRKPKRLTKSEFVVAVRELTVPIYRTRASQCPTCGGRGHIVQYKKDGTPAKRPSKCKVCDGKGIVYTSTGVIAGLRCVPTGPEIATALGFSTDGDTLDLLKSNGKGRAVEFLTALSRKNAIDTYITTFIGGIKRGIRADGLLHTSFMQCVAATGRLSSRDPNFQNLPRANNFPIRKTIISRWPGGKIADIDFAQLEFRCAVAMANCPQGLKDIMEGADIHSNTAKVLTDNGQSTSRQDAKAHTFKPLYGGTTGTPAEQAYYASFLARYSGIRAWQQHLQDSAIRDNIIRLPSGREYFFPGAKRRWDGSSTFATQIKNYPVQGFATGDIVPTVVIALHEFLRSLGCKTCIINTVHDSITLDVHPDEMDVVGKAVGYFKNVNRLIEERYGFTTEVPFTVDAKIGPNWMEGKTI